MRGQRRIVDEREREKKKIAVMEKVMIGRKTQTKIFILSDIREHLKTTQLDVIWW